MSDPIYTYHVSPQFIRALVASNLSRLSPREKNQLDDFLSLLPTKSNLWRCDDIQTQAATIGSCDISGVNQIEVYKIHLHD